jgi:hypothetical protein
MSAANKHITVNEVEGEKDRIKGESRNIRKSGPRKICQPSNGTKQDKAMEQAYPDNTLIHIGLQGPVALAKSEECDVDREVAVFQEPHRAREG